MKKILLPIIFIGFSYSAFAQISKERLSYALEILYRKTAFLNQKSFQQETFAELSYLKRAYKLDSFNLNSKEYISSLNDFYYKNFFPYSKFLNENAIVTEDCIVETNIAFIKKLLFYTLYPNHIKLPKNIVELIEEHSKIDEFFGPYYALTNIYFLKNFNYNNLSASQKSKLSVIEKTFSDSLYIKYVKDVTVWNFNKFLSLKVLKMNNYEPVASIDISPLADFIINDIKQPLKLGEEDLGNTALLNRVGYNKALEFEANALLWIFILELNKN